LDPSYVVAAVVMLTAAGCAFALSTRSRDRAAFACLVLSPVAAALPIALWPSGELTSTGGSAPPGVAAASTPEHGVATSRSAPTPADALRQRGAQARIARDFIAARDAFAEVVRLDPDDADAWADLADASAAAANGDLGTGSRALERALALDPTHPKALWLQASLELQRKDYAAAAALWERLLVLVPSGTNDARIVASHLDDARRLAQGGG
jgi:cytochrome c-type biogenesis protein CcmH